MANPSKRKGTAFESALVAHIEAAGFHARRVALAGAADQGDIHVAVAALVAVQDWRRFRP